MSRFTIVLALAVTTSWAVPLASTRPIVLEYQGRYESQSGEPDHIVGVLGLGADRALVAGNKGLALLDPGALPVAGTQDYLFRLTGLNARDVYTDDGEYFYVNLHREGQALSAGFAVVRRIGDTLSTLRKIDEDGVMYEKMAVDAGYLYVAAHAQGIRIFSLANPADPVLVGSLETGFTDAFAFAVHGDTAFVADGAAGLKVVDVTDRTDPVILAAEDSSTAQGTSEDVTYRDGRVYVAAGGAGVAVYDGGDPLRRTIVEIGACAEGLAWVGELLAVSNLAGVKVLDVSAEGPPMIVGGEVSARRGPQAKLRLACGVGSAPGDRVLLADWNYMDVYRLVPFSDGAQPDITPSAQRIRFRPEGGTKTVALRNDGAVTLTVTHVTSSASSFTVGYAGGTLLPGESVSFDISYDGDPIGWSGTIRFYSNDPDENPMPIMVFGNSPDLDPGESAIDFTLPRLTYDHETGEFHEELFTLSDHRGKIVWFQVFAFW